LEPVIGRRVRADRVADDDGHARLTTNYLDPPLQILQRII
jgi:hypothetical protein